MTAAWSTVKLGDVLRQVERREPVNPELEYRFLGAKWYALGLYVKEALPASAIAATHVYRVEPGDFVYNRLFAWKGSFAVAQPEHAGCFVSNEFPCFLADAQRLDPRFLWWYFRQEKTWARALGLSTGATPTSRNRLKEAAFLSLSIPLPPLAEQRRIVARLDALAAKVEEAKRLSEQVLNESASLHSAAAASVASSLACRWSPVGDLLAAGGRLGNGRSVKSADNGSGVSCLTLSAVRNGAVDLKQRKPVPLTLKEAEPHLVHRSDVFVVRGNGNKRLCGQAGMVRDEPDRVIFPDLLIRLPLDTSAILPEFFVEVWNAGPVRSVVEATAKTTSGIWKVNQRHIESTKVPLPSLAEQRSIVARLRAVRSRCESVQQHQAETSSELRALVPSLVMREFAGAP